MYSLLEPKQWISLDQPRAGELLVRGTVHVNSNCVLQALE
jgi:hypothetical protein